MRKAVKHHMNLDGYDRTALQVKAEPRWGSVSLIENPCENLRLLPKALAASPDNLHRLLLQSLLMISVVDSPEKDPIHTQLGKKQLEH